MAAFKNSICRWGGGEEERKKNRIKLCAGEILWTGNATLYFSNGDLNLITETLMFIFYLELKDGF